MWLKYVPIFYPKHFTFILYFKYFTLFNHLIYLNCIFRVKLIKGRKNISSLIWILNNKDVFGDNYTCELTEEQSTLLSFSNIFEIFSEPDLFLPL